MRTKNLKNCLISNRIFDQDEDFRFFINKIKEMQLTKLSLILTGLKLQKKIFNFFYRITVNENNLMDLKSINLEFLKIKTLTRLEFVH